MKIAYHIGDISDKAENELVARLVIAAKNINFIPKICHTSSDLIDFKPDVVFSLHTSIPKLTQYTTLGCMWNPPHFFANSPENLRKAISYDIHLSASDKMTEYLADVSYGMERDFRIGQIYPSCHLVPFRPRRAAPKGVAYLGTNWDGFRYAKEMDALSSRSFMRFFGPGSAWKRVGDRHLGAIPFDGTSVIERLNDCGVTLSLHRPEHIEFGIPSMRVFEAVASSSVLFSDKHEFVTRNFSDTVFYVEETSDPKEFADQISDLYEFVRSNPATCVEMAREAHRIFSERFCLEKLIQNACDIASGSDTSKPSGRVESTSHQAPRVDCIVRTGLRSADMLRRSLRSLSEQSYRHIRVILINNSDSDYVRNVISEFSEYLEIIELVIKEPQGRSHSLWEGIKAIRSEYFCILDDDDRMHPNHLATVVSVLERNQGAIAAYGGSVRVVEAQGEGDREAAGETRDLAYFHPFDRFALMQADNFITSNSFLARSVALDDELLTDPQLQALEDLWLLILVSKKGDIVPTWRVTSEFFWRRNQADNITFNNAIFLESRRRILARLQFMPRPPVTRTIEVPFPVAPPKDEDRPTNPVRGVEFVEAEPPYSERFGFIDAARLVDGRVEIVGWAKWKNVSSNQRIIISGIKARLVTSELLPRPDIAVHMGDWRYFLSGFRIRFIVEPDCENREFKVFAVEDGGETSLLSLADGVAFPV